MTQDNTIAAVFGGTGFLGTQVVRELAQAGYRIKVVTRVPERVYELKPCGSVGQVVPVACDYKDEESIAAAVAGASVVVNMIGILYEKKSKDFQRAHVDIARVIAQACTDQGVQRFVHVSALGVDKAQSKYAKTKLAGEEAVLNAYPKATILRPSVMFGPNDGFFNMFACLPVLPLVGGGETKFQPVYVGDVADAVMKALTLPLSGADNPQGKVYELGGPEVLSFKEVYERVCSYTGHQRPMIPLPFGAAKFQGCVFSVGSKMIGLLTGLSPKPPLTADQVESLKSDNVVSEGALTLRNLGVAPTGMCAIVPSYLSRFKPGGRFGTKKTA